MASTPDPSEMSRDELKERVETLEENLDIVRNIAQQALEVAGNAHDRLDELEAEQDGDGFSEVTRDEMLPAHRMAVDIRNGYEDRIGATKRKRAAELFRRMMHKVDADGDPMPGVDNSGGSVTIKSSDAQEIIREFDDDLDTVSSMQVTRAFRELQRLTKSEDCDCDTIDNCGHGLVTFKPGATNTVGANTQRLINYLAGLDAIETTANGDVSNGAEATSDAIDADDAGNSVEATADETLDQLDQGHPRRENGTANVVVSSNERETLGDADGRKVGDTHE